MAIKICQYSFEGPYDDSSYLKDSSGVYVILCYSDGKCSVVDVGESAQVKSRIESHDRAGCWEENCYGTIKFSVYYTPNQQSAGRTQIESEIREHYNPPCGKK